MIVTYSKPYDVIKAELRKWKKIGIISCNSCARVCETGGRKKLEEMAERLKNDGYEVVDTELVPMACMIDLIKKHDYQAEILLVLACDSGVFTAQSLFPNKLVFPANDTIGLGAQDREGNIFIMKKC
jgi:ferredoxin